MSGTGFRLSFVDGLHNGVEESFQIVVQKFELGCHEKEEENCSKPGFGSHECYERAHEVLKLAVEVSDRSCRTP